MMIGRSYKGVRRAGGIMMIVQPSYGLAVINSDTDSAKLGMLLTTTIRHKIGEIKIIGTYWPTQTTSLEDTGLWNRTVKWMRVQDIDGNPLDYLQQSIN